MASQSHVAPETPGSIHEGGRARCYCHAYGAAFDNPDLIVTCIIGDGEAETGALAASWHSNKFLIFSARDGAVLPNPSSQRIEDRKSDRARAYQPPGIDRPDPRLRLRAAFCRTRRPRGSASKSG